MTNLKNAFLLTSLCITITSCSTFPANNIAPGYQEAFRTISSYIFNNEESIITQELINGIPYASSSLKIGKGPTGLIILESKLGNQYTWVSSDGVYLVIENGRIIQTAGLINNLINLEDSFINKNFLESFSEEKIYKYYQSYDNPSLLNLELEVILRKEGKETVNIYGVERELSLISEYKVNEYLGWEVNNLYWMDENFFVWKSVQHLSPKLPKMTIEVTKKPSM